MTSYLTSIDNISPSRTVFEIFDIKIFRVRPWPLTQKGHLGSNIFYTIRKPIYDFLFDFYGHHLSISYRSRDIRLQSFQGLTLTFDPKRSSGVKQKVIPFESLYMTPYLTSIDNISPTRTVFEIFNIKVLRVWPWPLTPKSHLGSKIFIPFGSPYTTSFLTSLDTISLSRTVREIFDFKVFRVWPWPLTPKGHLG